jgi:hypothetical protein
MLILPPPAFMEEGRVEFRKFMPFPATPRIGGAKPGDSRIAHRSRMIRKLLRIVIKLKRISVRSAPR